MKRRLIARWSRSGQWLSARRWRQWLFFFLLPLLLELVISIALSRPSDELLPLLFLDACVFRLYSLARSVGWLWFRSGDFKEEVRRAKLPSDEQARNDPAVERARRKQIVKLYRRTGGDFFPFGIRAIRLDDWSRDINKRKHLRRFVGRWMLYKAWKFYFFTIGAACYEYLMTFPFRDLHDLQRAYITAGGTLVLFGGLVIAVEGVLSFTSFKSWSVAYHRLDVRSNNGNAEFSAFVGGAATTYAAAAAVTTFIAVQWHGYSEIASDQSWWRLIGAGYYYALTAFTGNGDAGPLVAAGFLITALLFLEGITYLVVVISLLIDSLGRESDDPTTDAAD